MIKYSVIIPVYNVEEYLEKCVESVLRQKTESEFEIILVDDGSTDSSGKICDALAESDERIRVIHQENQWLSAARNTGLNAALGAYILYLDSDDWWQPELLAELDKLLFGETDMAMFGYQRVYMDERVEPMSFDCVPTGESGEAYLKKLFAQHKAPLPFAWCYVFRRDFLLDNGLFFNEKLRASEDFEYNMRAIPRAKSIAGTSSLLYNYLERGGSLTASISAKKIMDNLQCKAEVFRRYPVSAMAEQFFWNALLVLHVPAEDRAEICAIVWQNADIPRHVSNKTLRIASFLTRTLGYIPGAKCFWFMANAKKRLKSFLRRE